MKIYNSLSRKKEDFTPLVEGHVGMYVCGPTVYDEPHIGHARSAYVFDVIKRYLVHRGYNVTFVRNVTDVDDKIINKAKSELEGQGSSSQGQGEVNIQDKVKEVSRKYLEAYHRDMELLGIGRPDREPKATEYITKMIEFISFLIEKGSAYAVGGDVYFDIKTAKNYGKLSNQRPDKMEAGSRIASGEYKKDPLDFALWKKAKENEPSWQSPWGPGRPGWHIECSAMSSDILGDAFDIHGGGIDLVFPHHENEIAQSEGAGKKFARWWIHNGLLTINSEKMAKSLGNFITIKDFVAKYKDPDYLKLLFLNTHYRHPVDFTEVKIEEMKAQKERVLIFMEKVDRMKCQSVKVSKCQGKIETFRKQFEEAMDDDFNTPLALAAMFDAVSFANKAMQDKDGLSEDVKAAIVATGEMLGEFSNVFGLSLEAVHSKASISDADVKEMLKNRDEARARKDFKKADDIRKELDRHGIVLEDTKERTTWRRKL